MPAQKIDILVSFNKKYIKPFQVLLKSLVLNNPQEAFRVWLIYSQIPQEELQGLEEYCSLQRALLTPLRINRSVFEDAPVSKQYPQEMYYRLLSPHLLPEHVERVLYLDVDILTINPLRPLWEIDMKDCAFAAASHGSIFEVIDGINKVRLGKEHDYFNTGVILMDLVKARETVRPDVIYDYIREHSAELLLPDQDVFNYLYGENTLQVDDRVWNYDARYFTAYRMKSGGDCNMDWVIQNTVFLHFCGRKKPWKPAYSGYFSALYKHYMNLVFRDS